MFGAFDGGSDNNSDDEDLLPPSSSPDTKNKDSKKKKKSKKSAGSKRKPDEDVSELHSRLQTDSNKDYDMIIDEEDQKLRHEGELIEQIINAGSVPSGYDENDYVVE